MSRGIYEGIGVLVGKASEDMENAVQIAVESIYRVLFSGGLASPVL